MVEIKDIEDRKSLRAWLEGRQREDVVAIAHRAALRVLPFYLDWVFEIEGTREGGLAVNSVLWSSLISGVAAFCPTPEITDEIKRKASDASASAASAVAHSEFAPDYAAFSAAESAAAFSYEADYTAAEWVPLRADCTALDAGESLAKMPLWLGGKNPLAEHWRKAKALMGADKEDWSFWIKWYESALTGRPQPCALLVKIARIKPEDWKKGPKHVNGLIAEIEAEFERVEPEIEMTPAHMLSRNKSVIESQLDTLFQLVTEEINRLRGQNDFTKAEGERIAARLSVMESILAAIEKIKLALEEEEPSTALAVIDAQLPEVLSGAAELAKGEDVPQVSVSIAQMGETISFLTQKGTPGTLATGMAFVDWSISHPIKWWKHWRNSKS